jgi:hypothetical protein
VKLCAGIKLAQSSPRYFDWGWREWKKEVRGWRTFEKENKNNSRYDGGLSRAVDESECNRTIYESVAGVAEIVAGEEEPPSFKPPRPPRTPRPPRSLPLPPLEPPPPRPPRRLLSESLAPPALR